MADSQSEKVALWLDTRCMRHARLAGGGKVLLRKLGCWLVEWGIPAMAEAEFREMLQVKGFTSVNIQGTWMVMGLALKEDAEFYGVGSSLPLRAGERERR